MSKPSDIVNIAIAELGYKEKASNASLDDKAANAGSNNWTKYARDLAAAGYYNGNKNGFAWCDVFVDWCFFKAYGAVEGQRIQCQSGPLGAGCIYSAQYYQQKGRYDRTPKVGDQVFFQTGGEIGHTGIVVEVPIQQLYRRIWSSALRRGRPSACCCRSSRGHSRGCWLRGRSSTAEER